MADVSTLVLESGARTTTQPALIAFNARREAARAERMAWRTERIKSAEAAQRAAIESLTRPVKAPPKPKREPKPKRQAAPRPDPIRPCAGTCGRLTHPRKIATHPDNSVPRVRDGKCSTCLTGGRKPATPPLIRPCITCGHLTRNNQTPADKAPGTRPRVRGGNCTTCADRRRPSVNPKPQRVVDIDAIVTAYQAGTAIAVIAKTHKVSPHTVRARLVDRGVPIRGRSDALRGTTKDYAPELVEKVRTLYIDQGLTQTETGNALGMEYGTIARILKRSGIPARPSASVAGVRRRK